MLYGPNRLHLFLSLTMKITYADHMLLYQEIASNTPKIYRYNRKALLEVYNLMLPEEY